MELAWGSVRSTKMNIKRVILEEFKIFKGLIIKLKLVKNGTIWLEAAYWLQSKGIEQWNPIDFSLDKVRECFDYSQLFLAWSGDVAIGTFSVQWSDRFIWKELDNNESGYIHKLAVRKEYSGQGIGSYLLSSAEKYIKKNSKQFVRLDCMADNLRLNKYYIDNGYQYKGRMDEAGWNANLYEKVM